MGRDAAKDLPRHERELRGVVDRALKDDPWSVVSSALDTMLRDALKVEDDVREELVGAVRALKVRGTIAEALGGRPVLVSAKTLIDEARVGAEARAVVLRQRLMSASEVGRFLGSASTTKPSQYAHHARRLGKLLGLPIKNSYLYPSFQFDRRGRRVRPIAARLNQMLGAARDPWGVASWWVGPNERIGGRAPIDLLDKDEASLEKLAALEAAPLDP